MEYSILEGGDWVCKSIATTMGTEGGGKSIANTEYSGVGSKKRANITYIIKKCCLIAWLGEFFCNTYKSTCLKKQRRGKGAKQALVRCSFFKHEMKGNEVNWGQIAKNYCAS